MPLRAFSRSRRLESAFFLSTHIMISRGEIIGGGERDRTDDLLLAKQALSQLSYTPEKVSAEL